MCLSAAYAITNGKEEKILDDINSLEIRPGKVILTDLFGRKTEVPGTLISTDMTGIKIRIASATTYSKEEIASIALERANTTDHFASTFGLRVLEVNAQGGLAELDVTQETLNSMGGIHGGAIATLADTLCGSVAAAACGYATVTLSSNINYIAGKRNIGGKLICKAHVLHAGRSTAVIDAAITDETDKLIATGTFTFHTLPNYTDNPQ